MELEEVKGCSGTIISKQITLIQDGKGKYKIEGVDKDVTVTSFIVNHVSAWKVGVRGRNERIEFTPATKSISEVIGILEQIGGHCLLLSLIHI